MVPLFTGSGREAGQTVWLGRMGDCYGFVCDRCPDLPWSVVHLG